MVIYLLKSAACMGIFLLFYKLLLEKESMHHFKRFFLLTALVASFIIPQVVFTEYVETIPTAAVTQVLTLNEPQEITPVVHVIEKSPMNWSLILWTIYGLGVAVFGFRFLLNLTKIWQRVKRNTLINNNFIVRVLLKEQLPPHTFLRYIFLNKQRFESKNIPDSVIKHEETHALQWHSLDVIFIELLQILFWFNPLIYVYKKTIKLNHEFLADSAVLNGQEDYLTYQNTLLSYLSNDSFYTHQSVGIANAINYSSTRLTVFGKSFNIGNPYGQVKKRFIIMKKQTSKKGILIRSLFLLPVLALMLYGFSQKNVVTKNTIKDINIEITKTGDLLINDEPTTLENLSSEIERVNQNFGPYIIKNYTTAHILYDESQYKLIDQVKTKLGAIGISNIEHFSKRTTNILGKNEFKPSEYHGKTVDEAKEIRKEYVYNELKTDANHEPLLEIAWIEVKNENEIWFNDQQVQLSLLNEKVKAEFPLAIKSNKLSAQIYTPWSINSDITDAITQELRKLKTKSITVFMDKPTNIDKAFTLQGEWLNADNEVEILNIRREKDNLYWGLAQNKAVNFEKIGDQYYYFSNVNDEKIIVELSSQKGTIIFDNKKYIRKENSLRNKLNGTWVNNENNIRITVSEYDIYMVFDLLEGNKKDVRYYPKKRGNSYYFTYGYKDWSFRIENNQLVDSKGNYYTKLEKQQSIKNSNRIIRLAGLVIDSESLEPIVNVEIIDNSGTILATTDNKGYYSLELINTQRGEIYFDLTVIKEGYKSLLQKEHWGNVQSEITSSYFFGLQKNNGATTEFSKLFTRNDNLDYASVVKNKSIIESERLFNSKLEVAKNGNTNCIVEVNEAPYLVDATSWIKLNSTNDIIAVNDKENIPASKLNGYINRNNIKAMSPLENYDTAQFAVYTTSGDINANLNKRAFTTYNNLARQYNAIPIEKRSIPKSDLKILESTYKNMTSKERKAAQPFPECLPKENQDGASEEQMIKYNGLAKKYNSMIAEGGNIRILKSDVDELTYIYRLMSSKQKENVEPFPNFPKPPAVPKAPKAPNTADYADAEIERIIATQDTYDGALMLHKANNLPHNNTTYINIDGELKYDDKKTENTRVYIFNSDSSKTKNNPNLMEDLRSLEKQNAQFYFEGEKISSEEGFEIIKNEKSIKIETLPYTNRQPEIKIYKKTNTNLIPPPPSPPTPPSPLDYAISMAKKGATFFYEGKKVSSDKAIDLLKKNKDLNIESREKNGKAEVRITKEPVTIE